MITRGWRERLAKRENAALKKRGVCDLFMSPGWGFGQAIDTGDIGHSMRARPNVSAYISRTPASTTNTRTFVRRWRVKRAGLGNQAIACAYTDANNFAQIVFRADDTIQIAQVNAGTAVLSKITSAVFRSVDEELDIALVHDTYNAVNEDKVRLYINNVRITSFSTNVIFTSSSTSYFNDSTAVEWIGRGAGGLYSDSYFSRCCGIDGTAITDQTGFGYYNSTINKWVDKAQSVVKALVDTGGANSFMLDFDNGASLTALGNDKSSKGNNWTLNNFSLTAGPTYDWMLDVPGNRYATLNPVSSSATMSITGGNLNVSSGTTATSGNAYSSIATPAGKFKAEVTIITGSDADMVGICPSTLSGSSNRFDTVTGGIGYYSDGRKSVAGVLSAYGASYTSGDVIRIEADLDAQTVTFFKNDVSQGTISGAMLSGSSYYFASGDASSATGINHAWNFGQRPFANAGTTGFKSLCQANLPDIPAATLNPLKHAAVVTRAGTGSATSISSLLFQPDFFDGKSRNNARSWRVLDSVRGALNRLATDLTDVETSDSGGLTAFLANGYSLGTNVNYNGATDTFVDLLLKAGGAPVTNNAGSIQSQVSANVAAGFSIVTATSNGADPFTIGHGLPVAPRMVVFRNLDSVDDWYVAHYGLTNMSSYWLRLNSTAAVASGTAIFGSGPTSTTIGIRGTSLAGAGKRIVAYCFADNRDLPGSIFRCFSYGGNNSSDGPYVDVGGKILSLPFLKRIDAADDWVNMDAVRDTSNPAGLITYPNLPNAEFDARPLMDFCSTGIKIRRNPTSINALGTYIGLAILGCHGKYS